MAQGTTKGVPIDIDGTLASNSDLLVASQKATKTYVDNGLLLKQDVIGYTPVNKAGDTMIGNLILNANPTLSLGAATKDYVDTLINGIDWKQSANAATVSALPTYAVTGSGQILTGTTNGAISSATTDGVTLSDGNRVLVKNETSTLAPNNGIYVVTQAGSGSLPFILTRASDANAPSELSEATLSVSAGTTLSNTQWHCNPASIPVVIGTTSITFAQIGSGVYTAGAGLTLTGNIFSIATNGVTDAMIQSSTNWNTAYTNRITSATSPLSIASNVISISQATNSTNGYLSSTDWSTFNSKQNTITLTTTGTGGLATFVSNTLNIPAYQPLLANPVTGTGVSNEIAYWVSSFEIGNLSVATYPSISELSYVKGVTSSIQTQINGKQNALTLTTTGTSGAATLVGSTLNIPQYAASMAIGGSITSATAGSVLFAGASGVLQQDNANFFWDDTNNRLGIGTNNPTTDLFISRNQNATTSLLISNTTSGTASTSQLQLISDSTSGSFSAFKTSTTYTTYKILVAKDAGFYNGTTGGDFSFLNDFATGKFKWAMGGSSTAQMTLTAAGRLLLGTTTESTYILDVNGTTRLLGSTTFGTLGSGTGMFWDNTNNRLGIGVSSPLIALDVIGGARIGGVAITGNPSVPAGTGPALTEGYYSVGGYAFFQGYNYTTSVYIPVQVDGSFLYLNSNSGGNVGINTATNVPSAQLHISSTTKGFLPPRMTNAQRVAIATPAVGLVAYSTDTTEGAFVNTSLGWQRIATLPVTTTTASTATLTPNVDAADTFTITAQAVALSVANPTGTPINGQKMIIRIEDNGTARAITWSGTQYRASTDLALPTTTIATKTMYLGFIYNSTDTKWDLLAFLNNF